VDSWWLIHPGFLSHVCAGQLQSTLRSWAGSGPVDVLFMLGLLGIGVALILGIGLRMAAVSSVVLMGLMWTGMWLPAQTTSTGLPTGSNNPVVDDHVAYALLLIALAMAHAGTRGLARLWARLPLVKRLPWLR
jgi:thiosulfate dehydrogenase [quinone] large subunit